MTFENSKRLYNHYISIGYKKAAQDILNKYPELAQKPKVEKEEKKDNSKKSE